MAGRREPRIVVNREFHSIEEFIHEYVTNVSRSGIFIKSKDPLPVGTRVALKFTIIVDDMETIEGVGEVVRVTSRPQGMGVVFTELTGKPLEAVLRDCATYPHARLPLVQ